MGLRIRTNIASINAQRRLSGSTTELQDSMSKLASGSRINKASDDAAGLAVSENLRADIRSLNMAKRNAADGVSIVQTAEGGLEETNNM
nr:flagellin [Oligoflexales bacterium]